MVERQPAGIRLRLSASYKINNVHICPALAAGVQLSYCFGREQHSPLDGVWMIT